MIVTAYPSSDVTRDEFTRAGHEFTTSDLCGIDFDLRLSRGRSKNNRRKDKSCNNGRVAHDHAFFRGRAMGLQLHLWPLLLWETYRGCLRWLRFASVEKRPPPRLNGQRLAKVLPIRRSSDGSPPATNLLCEC